MHSQTALVLIALVFCYALVSGLIRSWYVAPALIFMLLGMALGPFGLNVLDAGPGTEGYTTLAQLALTVILFVQASRLDLSRVLRRGLLSFRLIVIGIPVTLALGALTAALLLPVLPGWEAVCRQMEAAFRAGRFEEGAVAGIEAVGALLARHFPGDGSEPNEVSDRPVIL